MIDPTDALDAFPEEALTAEEVLNSAKVSLADLCAKGTAQYARKNYEEAADTYARASELQAELNGEMSPENAEILFLYGRSLFKVGQSKSDVLGGKASGEKKKPGSAAKAKKEETKPVDQVAEEGVAIIAEQKRGTATTAVVASEVANGNKPLFQFTGDENFEDSDEEGEGEGEEEGEEEDDLAAAFEVLDLARVLFTKKLEQPEVIEVAEGKGKEVGDSSATRHDKERLADTHDLLAEISLENERFPAAVVDFRASLAIKVGLYPEEHEAIAEAHYKLSLALEFASITRTKEEGDESTEGEDEAHLDQGMRDEAAKEMEAAIASVKIKLQNKEVELASSFSPDDNSITIEQIKDSKEIIAEMEQRLIDLKAPPSESVKDALYGPTSGVNPLGGILGTAIGESPADAAARIEEATKNATDLSGLVRHKKKPKPTEVAAAQPSDNTNGANGKRKADDLAEDSDNAKKAKVENIPEE